MAKRFLLNLLIDQLGQYVEGLNESNLKVGVLSGKIELRNLKLKNSALDQLDLPVEVTHGVLQKLRVEIPWTSLDRKPVKVFIDGVLLQASPIDVRSISKELLRSKLQQRKRSHLEMLDAQMEQDEKDAHGDEVGSNSGNSTYISRLSTKILDNLEVNVSNVHMRYEDSLTCSGKTFAFGIIIGDFQIATTDDDWNKSFLARDGQQKIGLGMKIHKLVGLKGISIYWREKVEAFAGLHLTEWEKKMLPTSFMEVLSPAADFIIAPSNDICVKLIHAESVADKELDPQVDITIEGLNLDFKVSKSQLNQIVLTLNTFNTLDRKKLVAIYRPEESPKENPRAWWKFAFLLVSGKEAGNFHNKFRDVVMCLQNKNKYISLLKHKKLSQHSDRFTFPDSDEKQIEEIESALPLCALSVFRREAMKDVLKQITELTAAEKEEKKRTSWFSWGRGHKKEKEIEISKEEDISLESLDLESNTSNEAEADTHLNHYYLRLRLKNASFALTLCLNEIIPIVDSKVGFSVSLDTRRYGMAALFAVDTLHVLDMVGTNLCHPAIISSKATSAITSNTNTIVDPRPFVVAYNSSTERVDMDIKSFPLLVCFNKECIIKLLQYVTFDGPTDASEYLKKRLMRLVAPYMTMVGEKASEMHLSFDIAAPTLILPEDSSADTGCIYADMGRLKITSTSILSDFEFKAIISDIFICVPSCSKFERTDTQDDVIQPFSMFLNATTKKRDVANITIDYSIFPSINADFTEEKFSRMLCIANMTSKIFTTRQIPVESDVKNDFFSNEANMIESSEIESESLHEHKDMLVAKTINIEAMEAENKDLTIVSKGEPIITLVQFKLNLPAMNLNLRSQQDVTFSIRDINMLVHQRNTDVSIHFNIRAFELFHQDRFFLWTSSSASASSSSSPQVTAMADGTKDVDNAEGNFVTLSIVNISSVHSPLYTAYGTNVTIALTNLGMNYDNTMLSLLRPYLQIVRKECMEATVVTVKKNATTRVSLSKVVDGKQSINGLHLKADIESVVLNLRYTSDNGFTEPENFYRIEMSKFFSFVAFKKSIDSKISLKAFEILDTRVTSQYYVYRTLLTKTNFKDQEERHIGESKGSDCDFFTLKVFETLDSKSNKTMEISLVLQDLTSFVSIDAVMDLLFLLQEYSRDASEFLSDDNYIDDSPPESPGAPSSSSAHEGRQLAVSPVKSKQKPSPRLHFNILIADPTIILLEDPLNACSRGVLACCEITAHFTRDFTALNQPDKDALQVSLMNSNISIFRNIQNRKIGVNRVIDPCSVQLNLKSNYDRGVIYTNSVYFGIDRLIIQATTGDILLLSSILSRGLLANKVDATDGELDVKNLQKKSKKLNQSEEMTVRNNDYPKIFMTYEINISIGSVSIILYDDIKGYVLPVLSTSVGSLELQTNGTTESLSGKVNLDISLNNYNYRTGSWEPLIEQTELEAILSRSYNAHNVNVSCATPIQINLSLMALKTLLQTITDVQMHIADEEIGDSHRHRLEENTEVGMMPPEPHLTWIENHLGIDIDIELEDGDKRIVTLQGRDWRKDSIVQTNITVSDADRAVQDALSVASQFDNSEKTENSLGRILRPSTNLDIQNNACIDVKYKTVNVHASTYKSLHDLPVYTNSPKSFFLHCDEFDKANELALKNDSQTARSVRMFIWDSSFHNGRRLVILRSPIVFRNTLSYPVMVRITTSMEQQKVVELGPINENGCLFLPLMLCDQVAYFQIRPHCDNEVDWSPEIDLNEYSTSNAKQPSSYEFKNQHTTKYATIYHTFRNKSLEIIFEHSLLLVNTIPTALRYACVSNGENIGEGNLDPGENIKLNYDIKYRKSTYVLVSVCNLEWSPSIFLAIEDDTHTGSFELRCPADSSEIGLKFLMKQNTNDNFVITLQIFSKYACVDRTCLGLSFMTQNRERKTYSLDSPHHVKITELLGDDLSHLSSHLSEMEHAISNFETNTATKNEYKIMFLQEKERVFSDRSLVWSHVPMHMRNCTYISTPCEDKVLNINGLMKFRTKVPSIVIIYRDSKLRSNASMFKEKGYSLIMEQLKARRGKTVRDLTFNGYAKYFEANSDVSLDGMNDTHSMYVVCVVPITPNQRILDLFVQVMVDAHPSEGDSNVWIEGGKGVCLLNPTNDDKVMVGINKSRENTLWTNNPIALDDNVSSNLTPLDIHDEHSIYHLAYRSMPMPGIFRLTKVVTFVPRFCIVNTLHEIIRIKQHGDESPLIAVEPLMSRVWHPQPIKTEHVKYSTTAVFIKADNTGFSVDSIDLNEIGTNVIILPAESDDGAQPIAMHVDVRLSSPGEEAYLIITIWKSSIRQKNSSLSIQNNTSQLLYIQQANADKVDPTLEKRVVMKASPRGTIPFGWIQMPTSPEKTMIKVGIESTEKLHPTTATNREISYFSTVIDMNAVDVEVNLSEELTACVNIWEAGKLVIISKRKDIPRTIINKNAATGEVNDTESTVDMTILLDIAAISVSLIVETPIREEFLSLYAEHVQITQATTNSLLSLECKVYNFQIDNYGDASPAPVIFFTQKAIDKKQDENVPWLHLSMIQNCSDSKIPKYKYLALLLMEFHAVIDTNVLLLYLADVHEYLRSVISLQQAQANLDPCKWMEEMNADVVSVKSRVQIVDISQSIERSHSNKVYVEDFVIHPIMAHVTFMQAAFSRKHNEEIDLMNRYPWVDKTKFLGNTIDDVIIKLNSFAVRRIMESNEQLVSRIIAKYQYDVMQQLHFIVGDVLGNLNILGKPVGLVKNIGGGLQDFFYAPAAGLMRSPEGFIQGLGKGTTSLLTGIVGGALSSTATIVGSTTGAIAHGASFVAGENDKYKKRESRRASHRGSGHGNLVSGLQDGGMQFVGGITSGITGLVTKPMEGAKNEGALGLFKGIGLGILGVAAKPVMGVTEGLSSIAGALGDELSTKPSIGQLRPCRYLKGSVHDPHEKVLGSISLLDAFTVNFVRKQPKIPQIPRQKPIELKTKEQIKWDDIESITIDANNDSKIIVKSNTRASKSFSVDCDGSDVSEHVQRKLREEYVNLTHTQSHISIEEFRESSRNSLTVSSSPSESRDPESVEVTYADVYRSYEFGKLQRSSRVPQIIDNNSYLKLMQERFVSSDGTAKFLDIFLSDLVRQWEANHASGSGNSGKSKGFLGGGGMLGTGIGGIRAINCAALVVINASKSSIMLLGTKLHKGESSVIFGDTSTFNDQYPKNTIAPRTMTCVFVAGTVPVLIENSEAMITVQTSAFNVTFGRKKEYFKFESTTGQFQCIFLEKSYQKERGSAWGKHILLVT